MLPAVWQHCHSGAAGHPPADAGAALPTQARRSLGAPTNDRHIPYLLKPNHTMSDEDLRAELERLRKENESLKKGASKGVSFKVSEKGAVSVYGMGRFPVTLYKEQWIKLLAMKDELLKFIQENDSRLKVKE